MMEESLTTVTPTGDEGIFDDRNFQQVMKEFLTTVTSTGDEGIFDDCNFQ